MDIEILILLALITTHLSALWAGWTMRRMREGDERAKI